MTSPPSLATHAAERQHNKISGLRFPYTGSQRDVTRECALIGNEFDNERAK